MDGFFGEEELGGCWELVEILDWDVQLGIRVVETGFRVELVVGSDGRVA